MIDWLTPENLAVAIGVVFSLLAEVWPWFQALSAQNKRVISIVLAIPLGAVAVGVASVLNPGAPFTFDAVVTFVVAVVNVLLTSQIAHRVLNLPGSTGGPQKPA